MYVIINIQLKAEVFNPPDIFPLISIVNKSCNIERCVKSMLPIFQNKIVSQGLECILSSYNGSRGLNTFENFGPIPNLRDADLT